MWGDGQRGGAPTDSQRCPTGSVALQGETGAIAGAPTAQVHGKKSAPSSPASPSPSLRRQPALPLPPDRFPVKAGHQKAAVTVTAPTWVLGGLEEGLGRGGGWLLSAKDIRVGCPSLPGHCADPSEQGNQTAGGGSGQTPSRAFLRRSPVPGVGSGLCPSGVGLDGCTPNWGSPSLA